METILGLIIFIAVVVLIIYSTKASNRRQSLTAKDFSKTYHFDNERKISKVKVGDFANVWTKDNSTQIYAYREDTFGGDGLIGICYNKNLHSLLNSNPKAKIDCRIESISGKTASINISIKPKLTNGKG